MRKLRLLVDAHALEGVFQGSRTYLEQIYQEAIRLFSNDIEFYFAARRPEVPRARLGEHRHVHYLRLESANRYRRLGLEFPQLISDNAIDWAHFQYVAPPLKRCRHMITTHDILFERHPEYFPLGYRLPKHSLFRSAARAADLLTTVSDFSRRELHHFYDIDLDRIHVITNGVAGGAGARRETEPSRSAPWDRSRPYLLFLSRMEPRKNHLGLLNAVLELGLLERGYSLVFVGTRSIADPSLHKVLGSLDSRVLRHIHHLESVSEAEKATLLNNARLFVYPSLAEGFGIPPLEAAMAGAPVVCSNRTAMAEFDFFSPYHVDPLAGSSLRDAIAQALEEKGRGRLQRIAETIAQRYSWEHSARQLMQLLLAADRPLGAMSREWPCL
ncbi:MAG: glycosyltransferase family 4 protein [Gammaproteobacteria bacterium]|nr:glycosyltransferase family 4 protein [Gammaproteobacteria bacterium]